MYVQDFAEGGVVLDFRFRVVAEQLYKTPSSTPAVSEVRLERRWRRHAVHGSPQLTEHGVLDSFDFVQGGVAVAAPQSGGHDPGRARPGYRAGRGVRNQLK